MQHSISEGTVKVITGNFMKFISIASNFSMHFLLYCRRLFQPCNLDYPRKCSNDKEVTALDALKDLDLYTKEEKESGSIWGQFRTACTV